MAVNASSRTPEPKDEVAQKGGSWRASLSSSSDAISLARWVQLAHLGSGEEHVALLVDLLRVGLLRRWDDLLDEGVAAVFGLASGEAELLALSFHVGKFTPDKAATWLAERGFKPLLFVPNSRSWKRLSMEG